MASRNSFVLDITVSHTAATGKPIYIRNENTREKVMLNMDASGVVIYDLQNMPSGFSARDRIVVFIVGEEYGVADAIQVDTAKGGATITFTGIDESVTTSPEIKIG